jgi:hypothetical protein
MVPSDKAIRDLDRTGMAIATPIIKSRPAAATRPTKTRPRRRARPRRRERSRTEQCMLIARATAGDIEHVKAVRWRPA